MQYFNSYVISRQLNYSIMKSIIYLLFINFFTSYISAQSVLTAEKLWQLGRVSLEDVSPDGKSTVYAVTYYSITTNKGNTDLYIVDNTTKISKKITAFDGHENNARFRPDGKKIGFLKDGLFHEMNLDGSDLTQVSSEEMNGFIYSPKGNRIAFLQDVKYRKTVKEMNPNLPLANAKIMESLNYRHWKSWDDQNDSNVFFADYSDGKLTSIPTNIVNEPFEAPVDPDDGIEQVAFSPDGNKIAYSCKKLTGTAYAISTNTDIYVYNILDKSTKNVSIKNKGYDKSPVFSPDGNYLAWNSMERDGYEADKNRIFLYEIKSEKITDLTKDFDNFADDPKWSIDSKKIFFIGPHEGTRQIFTVDINNKKIERLSSGIFDYQAIIPSSYQLITSRVSMSNPAEIYSVNLQGEDNQLTFVNQKLWDSITKGAVTKKMVKTTDNKMMQVWVVTPPNFDSNKKYPSILMCQGGPQSMTSQSFSYRWNMQLMAANGYVVIIPCRRGMPGFGTAWNEQISGDWGCQAMNDLLSASDDMKKEPFIDPNRMGAAGASFGGYSVYWLAGNHQKRFKAFIAHCGLFNMESWYGTTEEMWFANWDLQGSYWQKNKPLAYTKYSPHNYVQNWDTPILVIHCEKDYRVPVSEGIQAFQAAQLRGIPSKFLYFEDEGHWVTKPQNSLLWQKEFFGWLDKYLK